MWRALFMAIGVYAILLGGECLVFERFELSDAVVGPATESRAATPLAGPFQNSAFLTQPPGATAGKRTFKPREWMPWSLLAAGLVVVIYTSAYTRPAPAAE